MKARSNRNEASIEWRRPSGRRFFLVAALALAAATMGPSHAKEMDAITVVGRCNFWEGNTYYACGGGDPAAGNLGGGGGGFAPNWGGGGGWRARSQSAREQETDDKQDVPDCEGETSGNPVVLSTGNKVERELDFASGGDMGLFLARTYNHFWGGIGLFGRNWLSNFDYSLAFSNDTAWAQRPDGRRLKFKPAGANRWNEDKAQPIASIVRNGDGTYTLRNEDGGTEVYDTAGYVLERRNAQGVTWSFAYDNKYLRRVTHSSGRSVQFGWSNGQLTHVMDPAGNVVRFTYWPIAGTGRGRLAGTTLPGSPETTIAYHYEDSRFAGALTGKSFNGVRYSTFAYDSEGRAISTEHAGGVERTTFQYEVEASEALPLPPATPPPGGFLEATESRYCIRYGCDFTTPATAQSSGTQARPTRFRVTETNPLGRRTTHLYEDGRKVSVSGDASPHCAASYRELTYDANGYEDIVSDATGRLTDFDHDAHGHLLKRVEAAGTPLARTTTQEWDEVSHRVTRVTVAGERDTRIVYTPDGRLASVAITNLAGAGVVGQTRTTTYQYTQHANDLLATVVVDGPLPNDTQTSTYSATGDLVSVRDGAGLVTTYSRHNGLGQPGRVTDANGAVTEFTWDARGRMAAATAIVDGVGQTTRYSYDAFGLPATTQSPDGAQTQFVHDAARRLVEESTREPDGVIARKVTTYNAMSQPTRIDVTRTGAGG